MASTCSSVIGHFNGHGVPPVQYKVHLHDAACPGLLRKPLDAPIGQLLAPYHPSGCQGNSKQNKDEKMYQKDWPF
jgi:hypothetical protein